MSAKKFNFESKKIESSEQQPPIETIEPKNSVFMFWLIVYLICLAVFNILDSAMEWQSKAYLLVLFSVAVFLLFPEKCIDLYKMFLELLKGIAVIIGCLIALAIAIWVAILAFNGLSMPIASMPVGLVILLVYIVANAK